MTCLIIWPVRSAVEILAEGKKITFRHLPVAELGPALLDAVGFLGEVVDDVHRRFGGGHGLVRRFLGLGDDEVEAFLGVGDLFLGQFTSLQRLAQFVEALDILLGQVAGLGLAAHPSSLSKIFSIFSFSVAAVKGLTI